MSKLELLLKKNNDKILKFDTWTIYNNKLKHCHYDIYSFMVLLGDDEMTFYMNNGLIFELTLNNNLINLRAMSVNRKTNSYDSQYEFIKK